MSDARRPAVSVVLPTYNRARFLAGAFASIRQQELTDWELIVVDDGSTDDSVALVHRLRSGIEQPVVVVEQPNRGAYGARNTGLSRARGEYVAFFDSDDVWLPHHLSRCVNAMTTHADLDWVFGAVRRIDHATGHVLDENSFYPGGRPRPFLGLRTRPDGALRIIDDAATLACQIEHGLYCGLQNSVIRRRVFEGRTFRERFRVVEDELFLMRVLAAGLRIAYFEEPHVVYSVHEDNSSGSAKTNRREHSLAISREMIEGLEALSREATFTPAETRVLRRRLSQAYFWRLGYHDLWEAGRRREALVAFRQGLTLNPWDWRQWKSYVVALARTYAAPGSSARG